MKIFRLKFDRQKIDTRGNGIADSIRFRIEPEADSIRTHLPDSQGPSSNSIFEKSVIEYRAIPIKYRLSNIGFQYYRY